MLMNKNTVFIHLPRPAPCFLAIFRSINDEQRANKAATTARNASIVAILLGIVLFVVNAVYYGSEAGAIIYGDAANA